MRCSPWKGKLCALRAVGETEAGAASCPSAKRASAVAAEHGGTTEIDLELVGVEDGHQYATPEPHATLVPLRPIDSWHTLTFALFAKGMFQ